MQNARNSLCRKQWTIFMRKQWTILVNAENRFYECSKQIRIYSKPDVLRANLINVKANFINVEKLLWNLNITKHTDLAFKFREPFQEVFYEKTVNNLCSEQRIIYVEKRVNNFLNNVEQKIILCKMLKIVYAENSENFLWENNE